MQTTLLGLAIAFIIALIAALVGPYFIDWNQFRPQFEAEASRILGVPVRVGGKLDARLLPAPSLHLHSVVVGGANDLGKVRADKLDVEFSLGSLMRGEVRATELTINRMSLDLGLDARGRIDWPASAGTFNLGSLAIDRLNLTGRIALHDAASRSTLELNDIAFSGDVRSLAGSIRGDGNFMFGRIRYPFRVSSGQGPDGNGTRVHLNIDPGQRAIAIDLDGLLSFDARSPRFEGAMTLATPAPQKGKADEQPWRVAAKVKADYSAARLDQLEVSYGAEERALKLSGSGDVRFGASPLLRAALSARQLDADRFVARENSQDNAAEPVRALPAFQALNAAIPHLPISAQVELASEQIMLGGRPLQDIAIELQGDAGSWRVHRLEFRAPGATRVSLSEAAAKSDAPDSFKAALSVDSSDPDALLTWLQGRGETAYRSQRPLRLRGDITVAPEGFAIETMKADIDGGTVEGQVAVTRRQADRGLRVDAELKSERLDLDAATAFVRTLAGPQGEWPDEGKLSLDVGRAVSAGQELSPLLAKVAYSPAKISLEQLKIGQLENVTLDAAGNFDRLDATGWLALNSSAASLSRLTSLIVPFSPALAARLNAMGTSPGPARLKLALDLTKNAADRVLARAIADLDAPLLKGGITITGRPAVAAIRGLDVAALGRSEVWIDSKLSSEQGRALLALLGIDRVVAAGDGPARFDGTATGAWGAPLRLKAKVSASGLDAEAEGSAEPWAAEAKANLGLKVRSANFGPLLDLKPQDTLAQNIGLSARVQLTGNKLTFDDLDSTLGGSRLRGRMAVTLAEEKEIEGEIGAEQLALAPAFALALGAAGHDAAEPLGTGLVKGWRGRVAFQALRGLLPGGSELQPVSGVLRSDGQSLTFDAITGKIGGGEVSASIDARPGANGIGLNASVQFKGVDGAALRYRNLAMPAGQASLQMTLTSQGRSAAALAGAMSGSGTLTLEAARIAGLDPRAFEVAVRANDTGQAKDDVRLKQIVEATLPAGALAIPSAQIPFTIRDGRLRVGATALDGNGVRATVSGGYDIAADQADIRAALSLTMTTGRPEIQLLAVGTPDALTRSVDVAPLSSWLAVRAIDHETKRLDAIERGEPPPAAPPPIVLPAEGLLPIPEAAPAPAAQKGGRDRRPPAKKAASPRPPTVNAPAAPVAGAPQVAPLPPPINVRPAPGAARPRPPLALTPQVGNPPPRSN
ncbi:AsmA-like C-terminal region-containing protein [Bradyrhizobium sp. BWA-3-5]|uniref:AsmA family protein n=1 Tax=Bradyrhizobium sp. BWA-3-5 TaxID=3080013 RepID=UPI00293E897A|nr:AsmA-like C-terminal region-containing protein [Bradyrhizobium sp. BWA-3-5]WOH67740.1 AsmA-like C-terminal region-containing protein [Bradyrhizobium sp. BWA-3-5]